MARFEASLDDLFTRADPQSLLDVGCGEGVLTHQWAQRLGDRRIVGIDLEDPAIQAEWETAQAPNLEYKVMKAENLPFADGEFDVATAIEVLEHVPDPEHTLAEMARVASGHLLVCVPREPLWRVLNMARGAYLKELGNTPGHVNHWSKAAFTRLLRAARHGRRGALAVPVDHAARPGSSEHRAGGEAAGRGARLLSIGIASTGVVTFAYFSVASYVLDDVDYKRISLLWSVLFVTVSVIYRPIEQLLSRTIADRRARGHETGHPLRTPLLIQAAFAATALIVAFAFRGPITDDVFDGEDALFGVLVAGVLFYAASYFARGWLAGTSGSGSTAGLCSWRRARGCCSRSPSPSGSRRDRPRWRSGMAAAPLVSLVVVPLAFSRRRREPRAKKAAPTDDLA